VSASYDVARTTDDNKRHWAAADSLSARSANSSEVRQTLRDRARYEAANNSYCRGIVQTLANDLIGTGPRPQVQTGNADADRKIEKAFAAWSKAVRLAQKLRTMRQARAVDGEAFAMFTTNRRLRTPAQLDLKLVEAEQVASPLSQLFARNNYVDGIVFDTDGEPSEYHVLQSHPGDLFAPFTFDFDKVPADQMLHWFRCDRPGQVRGVPDIMPALPLFAQLRRYTLAVIAAAETAADFAAVLETNANADTDASSEVEPFDLLEIEKRMMTVAPAGWKLSQFEAKQPTTTYPQFKSEILNEIARCLNMPFNVAAGNSASYNYASGRLDHQMYFKSLDVDRSELEERLLVAIWYAWLDEMAMIPGGLPAGLPPFSEWSVAWFWDGREHVDPQKEAGAQQTRLANHTTTLAREYAAQGLDWEDQLRQRARELETMRELGIPLPQTPGAAATQDASRAAADPLTDDEEDDDEETVPRKRAKAAA
jgi:lambda family phage portal protein